MICLACGVLGEVAGGLCRSCTASLAAAPDRRLEGGLVVRSAFAHRGAARVLVRRLKYEGIRRAALPLAAAMAARLPPGAAVLVPVPRVRLRRWRYGVDPARELAGALASLTGLPVAEPLEVGWWSPPRAGRERSARSAPSFGGRQPLPAGAVLVDDVVTTGGTLVAAARARPEAPSAGAVTATAAPGLPGYSDAAGTATSAHR